MRTTRNVAFTLINAHPLDYVVVGSDSGRIVILEYNTAKNVFDKVSVCVCVASRASAVK